MTLRQTVQAAQGKTSELIAKLSETSNQALKTREGLFAQLGDELTRYVEIEEQHFLPLLRKHDDTKNLVPDALQGSKQLRALLQKLTGMPKDTDAFLDELEVLNKSFQQHIRNERKELLPAVLEAFSSEEASDLAADIDSAVADADKTKREAKREEVAKTKRDEEKAESDAMAKREAAKAERDAERDKEAAKETGEAAKAKREFDKAEQTASTKRAAAKEQKSAERIARQATEKAAETTARDATSDKDAVRQSIADIAEQTQQIAADGQEAIALHYQPSRSIRDDLQSIGASSTGSASATTGIYSVWMDYVSSAARINATASQHLMRCKSIREVADLQREFATSALRSVMERNAKVFKIALRTSAKAMGPLGARLD